MWEVISSIIQFISWGYIVTQLKQKKINIKKSKNIILIISMILCGYLVAVINFGTTKTIIGYISYVICYKFIYNISFKESSILNFISISLHCISEIILAIITILLNINKEILEQYLAITPLSGILIFIIILIIFTITKKYLIKLNTLLQKERISNIFYILLIIFIAILFSMHINKITWSSNTFMINGITIVIFGAILFLLFKEKIISNKINDKLNYKVKQSQEVATLLKKYQKINHENKNDLRVIKGKTKENKEVQEYINLILEEKNIPENSKWIGELAKIDDIDLNSFLSLKINDMVDNKMKVIVIIGNRVKDYQLSDISIKNKKDLYRILGIYLDNAYEASKDSEEKEITLEINIVDDKLEIIISNTFIGEINLTKFGEYGYTTKGKEHGTGLSLVNDIINGNNLFIQNREIRQNYYYQYLYIKVK